MLVLRKKAGTKGRRHNDERITAARSVCSIYDEMLPTVKQTAVPETMTHLYRYKCPARNSCLQE